MAKSTRSSGRKDAEREARGQASRASAPLQVDLDYAAEDYDYHYTEGRAKARWEEELESSLRTVTEYGFLLRAAVGDDHPGASRAFEGDPGLFEEVRPYLEEIANRVPLMSDYERAPGTDFGGNSRPIASTRIERRYSDADLRQAYDVAMATALAWQKTHGARNSSRVFFRAAFNAIQSMYFARKRLPVDGRLTPKLRRQADEFTVEGMRAELNAVQAPPGATELGDWTRTADSTHTQGVAGRQDIGGRGTESNDEEAPLGAVDLPKRPEVALEDLVAHFERFAAENPERAEEAARRFNAIASRYRAPDLQRTLDVNAAMAMTQLSKTRIQQLPRKQGIGELVGGRLMFTERELRHYLETRKRRGRPSKSSPN